MRRRGSSQIRSIQSLLMPPGTSSTAMGQFVAPLARDSAARLLVGFLRAHDLIAVRRVNIDETSAEMLATLVPPSDAPPGGYEASRAGEIARWQAALGQDVVRALQHEVRVTSAYLAKEALARVQVMPALGEAVLDALCAAAFPDEARILAELARFPIPMPADFVAGLARSLIAHAGADDDPAAVTSALTPLVATVKDDFLVSAMIIKQSSGEGRGPRGARGRSGSVRYAAASRQARDVRRLVHVEGEPFAAVDADAEPRALGVAQVAAEAVARAERGPEPVGRREAEGVGPLAVQVGRGHDVVIRHLPHEGAARPRP